MSEEMSVVGIVGIALSALIVLLFVMYCCKAWTSKKSSNYFSAYTLTNQNSSPGGSRNGDKSIMNKDGSRLSETLILKTTEDSTDSDHEMREENSRIEQRMLLQAMTSRKLLF